MFLRRSWASLLLLAASCSTEGPITVLMPDVPPARDAVSAPDVPAFDAGLMDAPDALTPACARDQDCDDGISCTVDTCADGVCGHRPENTRCDDGRFCNGPERCAPELRGCAAGAPPRCDDGDACTVDTCDEGDNACRSVSRDLDRDGDPDRACGGTDCDDNDSSRRGGAAEVCNNRDDDCDGMVDEGARSACGNCDPTCRQVANGGADGATFPESGRRGVELDPAAGGLLVRAETRTGDYLWVPNTNESTVSKWDATMSREIARYRVGLPAGECRGCCCWCEGCNMPSRVAVDGFGDAYVANRGFTMQGTVTKIAADIRDCVDRNGNGRIDTSTSATPLAWDTDECVLWTRPAGRPNAQLRSMAVDLGDPMNPQGYPWVGGYDTRQVYKLNPRTGDVLQTLTLPIAAYGAVVTSDGRMWISSLDGAAMVPVDTTTGTVGAAVAYPLSLRGNCRNAYGITADAAGRIWLAGWDCRDVIGYDPATNAWSRVDLGRFNTSGGTVGRGISPDASGEIWVAMSPTGDQQSTLLHFPVSAFAPGAQMNPSIVRQVAVPGGHNGPSGLGFDQGGNLWLAHHYTSQLVRLTPSTGMTQSFTGPDRVYTYSDFTGSVRRTVIGTGTYTQEYDAGCPNPVWSSLVFDALTPGGTQLTFTAATADTMTGLGGATPVALAVAPRDSSPVNVGAAFTRAMTTARRHLRVTVTFQPTSMPVESPVLRAMSVTWNCPYRTP
ncbi:MAG: MopE-related protein [Polyangiales bacterium]